MELSENPFIQVGSQVSERCLTVRESGESQAGLVADGIGSGVMPIPTRVAARVILLDSSGRVLLFEGRDLSDRDDNVRFWFTVGGGLDEGESLVCAAERELAEETGMTEIEIVGPFHSREVDFLNHGEPLHQTEHYFAARASNSSNLRREGWTDLERMAMTSSRWWSAEELRESVETYFPADLPDLIERAAELV